MYSTPNLQPSPPPRFVTTALIAGTKSLSDEFGDFELASYFARSVSITIVGAVLFDLLLKSEGRDFTAQELVEHCEAVIIEDLKLFEETRPIFDFDPMPAVLLHFYRIMQEQVWPAIAENPTRKMTASLQRINYQTLEVNFARLEHYDGS